MKKNKFDLDVKKTKHVVGVRAVLDPATPNYDGGSDSGTSSHVFNPYPSNR